jgi:hypothetical protein
MSHTLPTQHPAVVLRSQYRHLRALLVIAMIAVIGLSVAVVILASEDATSAPISAPVSASPEPAGGPGYIHSPGQRYVSPSP